MFSERIKQLRLSLGINQVEFGRRLGVSKQCISNWENGNIQPSIDMLKKIAGTFKVSSDFLLGLDDLRSLDVTALTTEQLFHIQALINDITANR
ncbi:MAG: helix-turn-helix transcriptional regulator [Ruminococcus sp.]|nr:helix-turn-helix transcriptional regulator [Ruminococcus sp.]